MWKWSYGVLRLGLIIFLFYVECMTHEHSHKGKQNTVKLDRRAIAAKCVQENVMLLSFMSIFYCVKCFIQITAIVELKKVHFPGDFWLLSWTELHLLWFYGFIHSESLNLLLFFPVIQRFVPTHRRNTSDYSSDSSSTGNSPETQHNVSLTCLNTCYSVGKNSRLKNKSYMWSAVTCWTYLHAALCLSLKVFGFRPWRNPYYRTSRWLRYNVGC